MKLIKSQVGNTIVELTLALAIAGVVSVPLTGIIASQLRTPLRVSNEINAARQLQSSTVVMMDDAVSSRSFTPGENPVYGTFSWVEFAGTTPVPVTARYYWSEGDLFRDLVRGGDVRPPFLVIKGLSDYEDLQFDYQPPKWDYDPFAKSWSYTEGRIAVDINVTREVTSEFLELVRRGALVADFRPQQELPAVLPDVATGGN